MTRYYTFFTLILCFIFTACQTSKVLNAMGKETVSPTAFKMDIPFTFIENQLFIPVYFEKEKMKRVLKFDNHAPFSLRYGAIENNPAITKVGKLFIPKPTPDGKTIPNLYYTTDSVNFGNVQFNKVVLIGTSEQAPDAPNKYDGLFGKNLMEKGVWKIDFEQKILTFASTLEAIENVKDAQKLATKFTEVNKIILNTTFENITIPKVEVDLGYNGYLILTKKNFDKIDPDHKAIVKATEITSVAGTQKVTGYLLPEKSGKIGDKSFNMKVVSNDKMTNNYLGMAFFAQFKFVIFDYVNKAVYVSSEKM
jgi:hypothetical protein